MSIESRPDPFSKSMVAAGPLVNPQAIDDIGTALARQVMILQEAGRLLTVNYAWYYENEPGGWARLVLYTEALYQQLHATATTAAVLLGLRANPRLKVGSLAGLLRKLDNNPSHPLEAAMRSERRAIALLTWLLETRNRAVQHSAERGYVQGHGMVLLDGFVLLRRSDPFPASSLRKARDLFRGLCNRYGQWNEQPNSDREALTYLDLASHELWDASPSDFDSCRRVLEEAESYDLVVSPPVLENADSALAALIGLITPSANGPSAR